MSNWIDKSKCYPEVEQGNRILAYGEGYIFECEFNDGAWCNLGGDDFTHWMHHPGPPQEGKNK